MPHDILEKLTPAQTESILLHESAHVRRRDNLGAALHMAVETLFWFHRGPVAGVRTLSATLNVVANGLDFAIRSTRPANVMRLQHLNNARALAGRALANADAAAGSAENISRTAAPETTRRFQLPDDLQGVDPALIGTYDTLNTAANILARSSGDPEVRARIAGDLDTIGNDILAALTASKEFNSGNGRGGRGGQSPGGGETLSAALNLVANRLDYVISSTRPANVERLQHLNNARALAGRALANVAAAAGSAQNRPITAALRFVR